MSPRPSTRILSLVFACAHLAAAAGPCGSGTAAEPVGEHAMSHSEGHAMDHGEGHAMDHGDAHAMHATADGADRAPGPERAMPCHGPPPTEWQAVCACGCDGATPSLRASHGLDRAVFPERPSHDRPVAWALTSRAPQRPASRTPDLPEPIPQFA